MLGIHGGHKQTGIMKTLAEGPQDNQINLSLKWLL